MDAYNKVYAKLSSEFCLERSGDRSVMLLVGGACYTMQQSSASINDLYTKLRDGVIVSFQQRSALYDADIRRLDSLRGTPQLDFRQLFLVKESLALMHQMMQLPGEALLQYEELEALLAFMPPGSLPDSDWPLVGGGSDNGKSTAAKKGARGSIAESQSQSLDASEKTDTNSSAVATNSTNSAAASMDKSDGKSSSSREKDIWTDPCRQGDDVLAYSINVARTKILKNKISPLELHRYVFARQFYFLVILDKPVNCAEKGFNFVVTMRANIEKYFQQRRESAPQPQHGEDVVSVLNNFERHDSLGGGSGGGNSESLKALTASELQSKQADLWAISASIRIARTCRDLSLAPFAQSLTAMATVAEADSSAHREEDLISHFRERSIDGDNKANNTGASRENLVKDSSRFISELLNVAISKLQYMTISKNTHKTKDLPCTMNANAVTSLRMASEFDPWTKLESIQNASLYVSTTFASNITSSSSISSSAPSSPFPSSSSSSSTFFSALTTSAASNTTAASSTPLHTASTTSLQRLDVGEVLDLPFEDFLQTAVVSFSQRLRSMMNQCWYVAVPVGDETSASTPPTISKEGGTEPSPTQRQIDKAKNARIVLLVVLLRLISEHESLAGRTRHLTRTKVRLGDLLLCHGYYQQALQSYQSALTTLSQPTRSSVLVVPLLDKADVDKNSIRSVLNQYESFTNVSPTMSAIVSSSSTGSTSNPLLSKKFTSKRKDPFIPSHESILMSTYMADGWISLRYWTIRKILLCARAVSDDLSYSQAALLLLEPNLTTFHKAISHAVQADKHHYSPDFCTHVLKDVVSLASCQFQKSGISKFMELAAATLASSEQAIENADPTNKSIASSIMNKDMIQPILILPLTPFFELTIQFEDSGNSCTSGVKMIHDEAFPVSMIHIEGGKSIHFNARIYSHFPCDIDVDSISIVYKPFSADELASGAPSEYDKMILLSSESFPTTLTSSNGSDNNEEANRQQAHNVIVCMSPNDNENSSNNNNNDNNNSATSHSNNKLTLHPGEQSIPFVMQPIRSGEFNLMQINIRIGSLVFTESLQCSSLADVRDFFSVHALICVDEPAHILNLDVVAPSFSPLAERDFLYLNFQTEDGDILLDTQVSSTDVGVEDSENWIATCQPSLSTWSTVANAKTSLQLPQVSGSTKHVQIQIPFVATAAKGKDDESEAIHTSSNNASALQNVDLSLNIKGILKRGGCMIPFHMTKTCSICIGQPFYVTSRCAIVKNFLFHQVSFLNCTPVLLQILSCDIAAKGQGDDFHNNNDNDRAPVKSRHHHNQQDEFSPIVLAKSEEYHAAFRVPREEENMDSHVLLVTYQCCNSASEVGRIDNNRVHKMKLTLTKPHRQQILRTHMNLFLKQDVKSHAMVGVDEGSGKGDQVNNASEIRNLHVGQPYTFHYCLRLSTPIKKISDDSRGSEGSNGQEKDHDILVLSFTIKESPQWMMVGQTKFLSQKLEKSVSAEAAEAMEYTFSVTLVPVSCGDSFLLPSVEVEFIDRSSQGQTSNIDNMSGRFRSTCMLYHLKDKQRRVTVLPNLSYDHQNDEGSFELEKVFSFIT